MSTTIGTQPDSPRAPMAMGSMAFLADDALQGLIAEGNDRAFEVLYERYRADLYRYCRAIVRNPQDAEEAFQLTMLSAYQALSKGGEAVAMKPWLYRIAHNQCASMIRARRPSSALSPDQPSPADLPEDQVALAEQIRHLRSDLGSLPALQRSALVMREMSGLSHRAIAQALSVEPADARQLVYEARRSLDECRIGREAGCAELRAQIDDVLVTLDSMEPAARAADVQEGLRSQQRAAAELRQGIAELRAALREAQTWLDGLKRDAQGYSDDRDGLLAGPDSAENPPARR